LQWFFWLAAAIYFDIQDNLYKWRDKPTIWVNMKTQKEARNILVIGAVGYPTYYRIPLETRGQKKDQKEVRS